MAEMTVTSSAFENNNLIPRKYTCQGEDISPPLAIDGIPQETVSLVLIMDDPDAPVGTWDHWVMWNLPVVPEIAEDSMPSGAVQGVNSWGRNDYGGPCPPSGTHRYFFKVYALDIALDLLDSSNKHAVEAKMEGHILEQGTLIGLYEKS